MDVFTALADPVRRELLRQVAGGTVRVVDLAATHPISRPAISRHLRVLHDAGLVTATDHGRERHYTLESEPLVEVEHLLDQLVPRRTPRFTPGRPPVTARDLDALETEVRRASRDRRTVTASTTASTSTSSQEHIA